MNLSKSCWFHVSLTFLCTAFNAAVLSAQDTGPLLLRLEAMLKADPGSVNSLWKTFSRPIISGRDDMNDSLSAKASKLMGEAFGSIGNADLDAYFQMYAGATAWAANDRAFLYDRLMHRAVIRESQGRYPEASGLYTDALAVAQRSDVQVRIISASIGLVRVTTQLGDLQSASSMLRGIQGLVNIGQGPVILAEAHLAEGLLLLESELTDSASKSLAKAEQFFKAIRDTSRVIESKIYLARCLNTQGYSKEAIHVLKDGLVWCPSASVQKIKLLVALAKTVSNGAMAGESQIYLQQADQMASTSYPGLWIEVVFPALSLRYAGSGSALGQIGLLNRYSANKAQADRIRDSISLTVGKIITEWERMDSSNAAIKGITKDRNRILYVLLAFLLSSLMAVIIIFRQHQRMRVQLRALFRKNLEEMQQAAETSAAKRMLETEPPSNLEDATVQARYQAILQLMERDKPWLDSGFSLQDLSTRLATNQKYISQAINMYSETGFSGMMNRYRVNEARRLILEGKPDTSLNDIALQSGFTNRVSFYRQFKEITGISPSEFVKMAR